MTEIRSVECDRCKKVGKKTGVWMPHGWITIVTEEQVGSGYNSNRSEEHFCSRSCAGAHMRERGERWDPARSAGSALSQGGPYR